MIRRELIFPAKQLRSRAVARYMRYAGYQRAVVFTCGNAATALRQQGVLVLEIGPQGVLEPRRWFTPAEIHETWPTLFDATSGHLSAALMAEIAQEFKYNLGELPNDVSYDVPTGSGETIVCLKIAYPNRKFIACYDQSKSSTTYNEQAPLNTLVAALFPVEHKEKQ